MRFATPDMQQHRGIQRRRYFWHDGHPYLTNQKTSDGVHESFQPLVLDLDRGLMWTGRLVCRK